jgi:hypothetical protein
MNMKATAMDQPLWAAIRNRTGAIGFNAYSKFINRVFRERQTNVNIGTLDEKGDTQSTLESKQLSTTIQEVGAYELLKTATQVFLLLESGAFFQDTNGETGEPVHGSSVETTRPKKSILIVELQDILVEYLGRNELSSIQTVLRNAFKKSTSKTRISSAGFLNAPAGCPPLIELLWSYWHEEAKLVLTMNAISMCVQNRMPSADRDPLAHLEIAPLFPLNNLSLGYIQAEPRRLSVPRRAYEYNHQYGLTLAGKAIPNPVGVDTRSTFAEAYHRLLYLCTDFFKQGNDTVAADNGFPVLNALKEVHLLLAEGAHNQFGDLPWTARAEMLMEQWILSRPEVRQFLESRQMVPYREAWMGQVETMKQLQSWAEAPVTRFNKLAITGEQILLTIRFGNWADNHHPAQAVHWARYWRPQIQSYIHSYRTVTGLDLRSESKP